MKTRSGSPTSPGNGSRRSTASVSASAPRHAAAGVLLTPEQVRAWRLARHHLDRRVPRTRLTQVVADLCGAHAQLMSREELADAVADRAGSKVRRRLLSGWGEMLKPAASRGSLIFGPSRGQHVTFARPDHWWGIDPAPAFLGGRAEVTFRG